MLGAQEVTTKRPRAGTPRFMADRVAEVWEGLDPREKRIVREHVLERRWTYGELRAFLHGNRAFAVAGLSSRGQEAAARFALQLYATKFAARANEEADDMDS